jgi:hypothetical protein
MVDHAKEIVNRRSRCSGFERRHGRWLKRDSESNKYRIYPIAFQPHSIIIFSDTASYTPCKMKSTRSL